MNISPLLVLFPRSVIYVVIVSLFKIISYTYSTTARASTADSTRPTISLSSPLNGSTYAYGASVTASASASDNVGVAKVRFYVGGSLKSTDTVAPYNYSFSMPISSSLSVYARAYDAAGNYTTSAFSYIKNPTSGDTTKPTVSLSSPLNGSTYSAGSLVTASATASDNVGVAKVRFYVGGSLKSTDTVAPYNYSFSMPTSSSLSVYARAYDAAGNYTTSAFSYIKNPTSGDTTKPTVSLSSPLNGSTYSAGASVTASASASDNIGVAKVLFYVGGSLKSTDTVAPYIYSFSMPTSSNLSVYARAYDAAGNYMTSAISYIKNPTSGDTTKPTVSLSSPLNGSTYSAGASVTASASASDNVGVAKVLFYVGGSLKSTDTVAPYNYSFSMPTSSNLSVYARAYDAAGNYTTSAISYIKNPISTPPPNQSTDPVAVITGARYYVSTTDGDDTRTALQAQNPSTPWKTIAKVNSFQSNLKPGDGVLFKRGDVFFGTLILQVSGTDTSPIQFSSYGSGERPVLTTFKSLTSWTQVSTGIYEASYTGGVSALNLLAINGKSYAFGRYPKLTDPNNGYLKTQSGSNETTIQDSNLPSGINWTGAEVVVRKTPWVNDRISVRSQSGTTLSLLKNTALFTQSGNGSAYSMKAGQEYFLQNHMATLKSFGDWAYDPLTKKVKVFFGSNSPSNYKVEVPHADNLIQINYSNNLAFSALNFIGSGKHSLYVYVSSHISIIYSKIQFSGFYAMYGELAEYFKFEKNEILDSQSNAFSIGNSAIGFIGRDNIFRRTSIFHGMSGSGDGHGFALNVSWGVNDNTIIERNQIYQTGYVGIAFNGSNTSVRHNLIDTYCMIKSDGGAIYTYNGVNKDYVNRTVSDNIITNSKDLMEGIPNDAIGIYIDDNGNNINISNNSVSNTGAGIFLHNTWDIAVSNNLSSNNHIQLQISNDNYGSRPMKNILIQSNIFIAKENSQYMLNLYAIREPISVFGHFTNNRYITPFDNTMIVRTWAPNWAATDISFAEWKQIYQKDLDSRLDSLKLSRAQGEDLIFVYNASPATKIFSNYSNLFNVITGQTVAGDLPVSPYRSAVLVGVP